DRHGLCHKRTCDRGRGNRGGCARPQNRRANLRHALCRPKNQIGQKIASSLKENKMSEIKFTSEHECIKVDGDIAWVGITKHAQDALGDLVYLELPEIGKKVKKGEEFAVVESVKTAAEVYSPVDGEVVEA